MSRGVRVALFLLLALTWGSVLVRVVTEAGGLYAGACMLLGFTAYWVGRSMRRQMKARRRRLAARAARAEAVTSYPLRNYAPKVAPWTPNPTPVTDLWGQVYAPTPEPQPQPVRVCTSYDGSALDSSSSCDSGPAASGQD